MNRFLLLLLLVVSLVGCGGGGGGGKSPVRTASAKFDIAWGARSRALAGPSSALSATVTLAGASGTGGNLVTTANRNGDPAAYEGNYVSSAMVRVGTYPLTVRFFAGALGSGDLVAEGAASVTIKQDGTGIGTVQVVNKVATVEVVAGQSIPVGSTVQLAFAARDAQGNLVAVSPGSALWSKPGLGGNLNLTADGQATGSNVGSQNVVATVDGISSVATAVTISSLTLQSLVVDPNQSLAVGTTKTLTFTARDSGGNVIAIARPTTSWTGGGSSLSLSSDGVATGLQSGTGQVQVAVGAVTSSPQTVTVLPATVVSIVVDPAQTVPFGGTKQLTFVAKDAQGNVVVVPDGTATWTLVSGGSNLSLSSGGLATALHSGSATVKVTIYGVVSPNASVTVASAPLASLTVVANQLVPKGSVKGLTFVATDAEGNPMTLPSGSYAWSVVSGGSFLSIAADGQATGVENGTATVKVVSGAVESASASVVVATAPTLLQAGFEAPPVPSGSWQQDDEIVGSAWTGNPHWGMANGAGSWGTTAHSGSQYAYIQASTVSASEGAVQQNMTGLIVGQSYRVKLWFARRDGNVGANTRAPIQVKAGGTIILGSTSPTDDASWTQVTTGSFVATSSSMALRIESLLPGSNQDTATLLDDVTIEFAP